MHARSDRPPASGAGPLFRKPFGEISSPARRHGSSARSAACRHWLAAFVEVLVSEAGRCTGIAPEVAVAFEVVAGTSWPLPHDILRFSAVTRYRSPADQMKRRVDYGAGQLIDTA